MRQILITIHGVTGREYRNIRADLSAQFLEAGIQPFFAYIPPEKPSGRVWSYGSGNSATWSTSATPYRGVSFEWMDEDDDSEDAPPIPEAYLEMGEI